MNWVFKKERCLNWMFGRWYDVLDDRERDVVRSLILIETIN
jgi:hypothetical protein